MLLLVEEKAKEQQKSWQRGQKRRPGGWEQSEEQMDIYKGELLGLEKGRSCTLKGTRKVGAPFNSCASSIPATELASQDPYSDT